MRVGGLIAGAHVDVPPMACTCPPGTTYTGCVVHGIEAGSSGKPIVSLRSGNWFIDDYTNPDTVFVCRVGMEGAYVAMAECSTAERAEMWVEHFSNKNWFEPDEGVYLWSVLCDGMRLQSLKAKKPGVRRSVRWDTVPAADVARVIDALEATGKEAEAVAADVLRAVYAKRGRKRVVVIGEVVNAR